MGDFNIQLTDTILKGFMENNVSFMEVFFNLTRFNASFKESSCIDLNLMNRKYSFKLIRSKYR